MGKKHDQAVDRIYNAYVEALEVSPWDRVLKETPYLFHEDLGYEEEHGLEMGEFDVAAIDYDRQRVYYVEVKTNGNDVQYGWEQIERATEYFDLIGWEVIGNVYLEQ